MPGAALTDAFMLGAATVMLGAQSDLLSLNTAHSIGLVKNVQFKSTPSFTDLTQGVKNTLVYSVMTGNNVEVSGELSEYTSKNLSYLAGLDGSQIVAQTVGTTVATAITAPTPPALSAATLVVTSATGIAANDYIIVAVNNDDQVFIKKVLSISTNTLTLDSGFPVGIPLNASVKKANIVALGSQSDQPFLSCKIVGKLANGDQHAILLPKVKITSGIQETFKTDGFDSMPLSLAVYDLVASDPNYAMFQSVGPSGSPAKAMLAAVK